MIAVAITAGASRVASDPLCVHAIATTPAGTKEPVSLVPLRCLRPSPKLRRVGSCIELFEACSAFTHVTACTLTKSLKRPSSSKAPPASLPPPTLRLLPGGANQFPGGSVPRCGSAPFTAHGMGNLSVRWQNEKPGTGIRPAPGFPRHRRVPAGYSSAGWSPPTGRRNHQRPNRKQNFHLKISGKCPNNRDHLTQYYGSIPNRWTRWPCVGAAAWIEG